MSALAEQAADLDGAPLEVVLRPLHGGPGEMWTVQLAEDLLSLLGPDGRLVMMLPREEAARHLRFSRDLVHGRVVSFVVVEGLKAYRFKGGSRALRTLLDWLPQRSQADVEREIRYYGMGLVALGAGLLVLRPFFHWGWGLALVGMGLFGIGWQQRVFFHVHGMFLAAVGLAFLFAPGAVLGGGAAASAGLVHTALGSLLLVWSVQQFSLLGLNHQLRGARAHRQEPVAAGASRSRLVVRVAVCALLFSMAFGVYAVGIGVKAMQSTAADWMSQPLFHDLLIFAMLALLTFGAGGVLLLRRRPSYLEAKITAQLLVIVAVLYFWGLTSGLGLGDSFSISRGILSAGLLRLEKPYVWAPLIVLVVLVDRWFVRAVERELARQEE